MEQSEFDQLLNATENSFIELIGFLRGEVGGRLLRKQLILSTELFDKLKGATKHRWISDRHYCPKCGSDVKDSNEICQNCV